LIINILNNIPMIKAKKYIPVEIGQNFYGQTINL